MTGARVKLRKLFFADFRELFEFFFMILESVCEVEKLSRDEFPSRVQTCHLTLSKRS